MDEFILTFKIIVFIFVGISFHMSYFYHLFFFY